MSHIQQINRSIDNCLSEFKESELGLIPLDWHIKKLSEICYSINDGTHFTPIYVPEGIPFYSVENITNNNFTHTKYIKETEHNILIRRCKPEKNNILMTRIGSLGDTKLIDWEVNASIYVSLALLKIKNTFDVKYIYSYSKYNRFVKSIEARALLNATPKKINMLDIGDVPIPIPPLPEQQFIAQALSDIDSLINTIGALITKKCQIKQGVMQQLLTGKKRLPGFSGKWKSYTFGKLFEFLATANNSRADLSNEGDTKYIHYGDIHTEWNNFVDFSVSAVPTISSLKIKGKIFLKDGDLVVADASEDYEGIAKSVEVMGLGNQKAVAGLHTFLLRGKNEILVNGYKGYIQAIRSVKRQIDRMATGLKVYGISKKNIKNVEVLIPPRKEQIEIANVIFYMDSELKHLEQQLEKTKALKQGMMQELLTGKTRLV